MRDAGVLCLFVVFHTQLVRLTDRAGLRKKLRSWGGFFGGGRGGGTGGQKAPLGTSLVVQWLRFHLPMQGTGVQSLVWEDSTCSGATKPLGHNY